MIYLARQTIYLTSCDIHQIIYIIQENYIFHVMLLDVVRSSLLRQIEYHTRVVLCDPNQIKTNENPRGFHCEKQMGDVGRTYCIHQS